METVILHIEYLLRHHDCVVLPGWGAFIARRVPASFRMQANVLMTPPSRGLAFNAELREDDGLLVSSICRREKMTYPEAADYVRRQVEYISEILHTDGEFTFGNLGRFTGGEGMAVCFSPAEGAVNYRNFGLDVISSAPALNSKRNAIAHVAASVASIAEIERPHPAPAPLPRVQVECRAAGECSVESHDEKEGILGRLRRNAVGIAATVAILLTAGLFFYNPINLENEPVKASIAPAASLPETEVEESFRESRPVPQPTMEGVDDAPYNEGGIDTETHAGEQDGSNILPPYSDGEHIDALLRFDSEDPYCVVVASFPDAGAATRYVSAFPHVRLGMLSDGGVYRVYCATAQTCSEAYALKELLGHSRAWVCMMN